MDRFFKLENVFNRNFREEAQMKYFYSFILSFLFLVLISNSHAQTFDKDWKCLYATYDNSANGTGYNVPSVAVVGEDDFVALVTRLTNNTCFLIGYTSADSANGRLSFNGYGSACAGVRQTWVNGFDIVEMQYALDLEGTSDGYVYAASNDADRNILVFQKNPAEVLSTEYRMSTLGIVESDSLWGIDVDANGKVYVSTSGNGENPGKILVYEGFVKDANWSQGVPSNPLQTITAPDAGELRGITVNKEGTVIYASNYQADKVYCYTGTPESGYTLNPAFSFTLTDSPISSAGDTLNPGPWGLNFMFDKNILFVACANDFKTGSGYEYGRIYLLNPNTGSPVDTIDCAHWNYIMCDSSYQSRGDGDVPGNASSYTSPYNVAFDNNYNVYSVSFYGWTVDKWQYGGTLPVIPLTITGVVKEEGIVPEEFSLKQNYPNPFNPSTTIEFSIKERTDVTLSVYSSTGELITKLINSSSFEKGTYKFTYDASKLASGNYFYTLKAGNKQFTKKMTLVK